MSLANSAHLSFCIVGVFQMSPSSTVECLYYFCNNFQWGFFLRTYVLKLMKEIMVYYLNRYFFLFEDLFSGNTKVIHLATTPTIDPRHEKQR